MELKKVLIFLILGCFGANVSLAFCGRDTLRCQIYFPVGSSTVNLSFRNNGTRLDSLLARICSRQENMSLYRVILRSGASPEGNIRLNQQLSDQRCTVLQSYIQERLSLPDSAFVSLSLGESWEELSSLVRDSDMPFREEAFSILRDTPIWVTRNGAVVDSRKRQLMNLRGGRVWRYMLEHFFPELRNCSVIICELESVITGKDGKCHSPSKKVEPADTIIIRNTPERAAVVHDTVQAPVPVIDVSKPFYAGIKTNLLYDIFLIPNIGIEFYLGKGWSLGGSWMYAWWKKDRRHRYWRVYGGEVGLRKYFASHAVGRPLSGHHIGVYGQVLTYDFELGGKGYMGGRPGGSLWEKSNYGFGLEYGYSLAIAKRLNLDFSLGVGYLGGIYYKYVPMDSRYVWQSTRQRHWFGPTKAEVSLVWFWGRSGYNLKKREK
ncbi:DUF3575 domain-containing protein [Bacteroides thetaiotaomicron]|uniref:DUF3575 domain-containing protein n=1 Tax=Bacteroides thetaiotaomicron TaxID=818 RepID=UPI001F374184|nr:DUF3575 domain-containing protein [Bacteroides thetaiotaomicron]MCE9205054.1 DUF3575 domain-containing protein [Bacteroides thetaiotaomicron]